MVRRIQFLHIHVVLIGADNRQSPGDTIVVADPDAEKRCFSCADDVPARRIEVDDN